MEVLEALIIADTAIKLGDTVLSKLKGFGKDTITREEFEALFELPDFTSFSKKATAEAKEETSE